MFSNNKMKFSVSFMILILTAKQIQVTVNHDKAHIASSQTAHFLQVFILTDAVTENDSLTYIKSHKIYQGIFLFVSLLLSFLHVMCSSVISLLFYTGKWSSNSGQCHIALILSLIDGKLFILFFLLVYICSYQLL